MIYTYSKSLDATGVLHPKCSEQERELHAKVQSSSMTIRLDRFSWGQIKPHMLKVTWINESIMTLDQALANLPLGVKVLPEENRLFWSNQATKWILSYLHYDKIENESAKRSVKQAKEQFHAAMRARRHQFGLISKATTPNFYSDKVVAMIDIINCVQTNFSVANTRVKIKAIHELIEAQRQAYQLEDKEELSAPEVMLMLKLNLAQQATNFEMRNGHLYCDINPKAIDSFAQTALTVTLPKSLPQPIPMVWKALEEVMSVK